MGFRLSNVEERAALIYGEHSVDVGCRWVSGHTAPGDTSKGSTS